MKFFVLIIVFFRIIQLLDSTISGGLIRVPKGSRRNKFYSRRYLPYKPPSRQNFKKSKDNSKYRVEANKNIQHKFDPVKIESVNVKKGKVPPRLKKMLGTF